MAVNTTEIQSIYDTLYGATVVEFDNLYNTDKISAETYANLVGAMSADMMKLAIDTVQKQELLDEQVKGAYTERVIKDKEAAALGLDNVLKLAKDAKEANTAYVYTPKYTGA